MIQVPDETFYFLLGHFLLSKSGKHEDFENLEDMFKVVFGALVWYLYMNPGLTN